MIELRWLTRKTTRAEYSDAEWQALQEWHNDPEPPPHPERVLQWREGTYGYGNHWYGGDWQDVPEISAASKSGESS